jgi:hypothetical protein
MPCCVSMTAACQQARAPAKESARYESPGLCVVVRVPQGMAAGECRCWTHGVGGADSGVAGLRRYCRGHPGGRPLRRGARSGAVRRVGEFAASGGRPDVRNSGPVGQHRRRRGSCGQRRLSRPDGRAGPDRRGPRDPGRVLPARLLVGLHLRARPQGFHRRPGPDDHCRPGARPDRRRQAVRQLLEKLWGSSPS